ncbi:MAG: hypothetical protein E6Q50_03870 [Lysobacter sp.]|nr:MAG: hypothetical protein E6Q50_03870 [Lysobacter sp.]
MAIKHRYAIMLLLGALSIVLAAIHSPGQMSVDSGMALYEGATGQAVGWGPTFFASIIAWLGGGSIGAALFVALNSAATYGVFAKLIAGYDGTERRAPLRLYAAALIALNPVFMFYVGILWKDVMLATLAMVASMSILDAANRRDPPRISAAWIPVLCLSAIPLLRQQGVLIAFPLTISLAWVYARARTRTVSRIGVMAGFLSMTLAGTFAFDALSKSTIAPLPASPLSVGFNTVRSYDVVGMVAFAEKNDDSKWTGADGETIQRIRALYSAERIDTLWHDDKVRGYFNAMPPERLSAVWLGGIKHDPVAYLSHRAAALRYLFGMDSMKGCVSAYWGVAAPSEYLARVGLREEMDPRDRLIGRWAESSRETIFFRHWLYAVMLALSIVAVYRRRRSPDAIALWSIAAAAVLYAGSYLPTTIACDFRYLYSMMALASFLSAYLLLNPRKTTQP